MRLLGSFRDCFLGGYSALEVQEAPSPATATALPHVKLTCETQPAPSSDGASRQGSAKKCPRLCAVETDLSESSQGTGQDTRAHTAGLGALFSSQGSLGPFQALFKLVGRGQLAPHDTHVLDLQKCWPQEATCAWGHCCLVSAEQECLLMLGLESYAELITHMLGQPSLMLAIKGVVAMCSAMLAGVPRQYAAQSGTAQKPSARLVCSSGPMLVTLMPCYMMEHTGYMLPGFRLLVSPDTGVDSPIFGPSTSKEPADASPPSLRASNLMRWQAAAEALPCGLTAINFQTGVVFVQNQSSRDYYGTLQPERLSGVRVRGMELTWSNDSEAAPKPFYECGDSTTVASVNMQVPHLLKKLFSCQPELLQEALESVQSGARWCKVMRVPATLLDSLKIQATLSMAEQAMLSCEESEPYHRLCRGDRPRVEPFFPITPPSRFGSKSLDHSGNLHDKDFGHKTLDHSASYNDKDFGHKTLDHSASLNDMAHGHSVSTRDKEFGNRSLSHSVDEEDDKFHDPQDGRLNMSVEGYRADRLVWGSFTAEGGVLYASRGSTVRLDDDLRGGKLSVDLNSDAMSPPQAPQAPPLLVGEGLQGEENRMMHYCASDMGLPPVYKGSLSNVAYRGSVVGLGEAIQKEKLARGSCSGAIRLAGASRGSDVGLEANRRFAAQRMSVTMPDIQAAPPLGMQSSSSTGHGGALNTNMSIGRLLGSCSMTSKLSTKILKVCSVGLEGPSTSATPWMLRTPLTPDTSHHEVREDLELFESETARENVWHEVTLLPMSSHLEGHSNGLEVMIMQTDVSARCQAEEKVVHLTEVLFNALENIFPRHVIQHIVRMSSRQSDLPKAWPLACAPNKLESAEEAQAALASVARSHTGVSIMFMDIVGFTSMSKDLAPEKVLLYLIKLYSVCDCLVEKYKLFKVGTAGDCYIVAGGLTHKDMDGLVALDEVPDHRDGARRVIAFSWALIKAAQTVLMPDNGQPTQVRVGIHTGDVTTGLVGSMPTKFTLLGDTMNTASRMESTCIPQHIQISRSTYELLLNEEGCDVALSPSSLTNSIIEENPEAFLTWMMRNSFTAREPIEVKGKGKMETFLCDPSQLSKLYPRVHFEDDALANLLQTKSSRLPAADTSALREFDAPSSIQEILSAVNILAIDETSTSNARAQQLLETLS